jgi:hypothetical protein
MVRKRCECLDRFKLTWLPCGPSRWDASLLPRLESLSVSLKKRKRGNRAIGVMESHGGATHNGGRATTHFLTVAEFANQIQ